VEPEPTHFETNTSRLKDKASRIFQAAVDYSYIQEKPSMEPKSHHEIKQGDFLINRIFAPWFKISYRVRGRTKISPEQLSGLIEGSEEDKDGIRKEVTLINTRKRKSQIDTQERLSSYGEKNAD